MITPSFGLTATERVLPRMALDFTTASLDSRVTFTRTTSASNPATYVDVNGYVTAATNNQPRFDFDPVTKVCKGLLIEESRANLLLQSANITSVSWGTLTNASANADVLTSPENTLTADSLIENSLAGLHTVETSGFNFVTASSYTFSIFAKALGNRWVELAFPASVFTARFGKFDLINGTVQAADAGVTSSIIKLDNGWYRCSITSTCVSGASARCNVFINTNTGTRNYTGDGTSGLYLWGAQLETGAFPTSYIPTTTTTLTRNADVATMTGTNFSDWFNASEGAFAVWCSVPADTTSRQVIALTDGTLTERILLNLTTNRAGSALRVVDGGVDQANIIITQAWSAGSNLKLTGTYKANSFATAINASTVGTDASGNLPIVDRIGLGNSGLTTPSAFANMYLQKVLYYPQRLIDAEVQAFSKG
jgi:hypothetical protein